MNPDFTNSASEANNPAWFSLPNSISQSRLQLANKIMSQHISVPPLYRSAPPSHGSVPPINSSAPPSHGSVPPLYSSAPPSYGSVPPLYSGAPRSYGVAPQTPLDFNRALPVAHTQSTASSKNSTSSNTESSQHRASSREQTFIVGPAFSLADSREGGNKLQALNASPTTSDSHLPAPVISRIQSLSSADPKTHSTSISSPEKVLSTQGPQICIGSVFSLADSHTEHAGQPETENKASYVEVDSSASRQTTQNPPVLPYVNQQNMPVSSIKAHNTVSQQNLTTLLINKQNQHPEICSALNSTISSKSVLGMSKTALDAVPQSKSSVSLEPGSATAFLLSLSEHCSSASAAPEQPTSVGTSIKNAQPSENHKNGSIVTGIDEQKCTGVLRNDKSKEKSVSTTEPQDSSSTPRVIPYVNKPEEPEVVDLDTEDIDDCMLVKIDLSRHHFPYGSKIHNSEVVIEDSDNEEDVTELAKDTNAALSGRTSSAESDKQKSGAGSSVAINESDQYGPTGSLSMEVEEIITEANNMSSSGTDTTYTMSSTGETCVTSVMSSRNNTQTMPESSCSTWRASETHNPEPELMDLHVEDDDDADVASTVEYVPLQATPSQPDNDSSTPVIQSVYSSSSFLGNTTDLSVLEAGYRSPFLEPTPQAQITGSTKRSPATTRFYLPQAQITESTHNSPAIPPFHSSQAEITGRTQNSTAIPHFHSSQAQITGNTQKNTAIPPFDSSQAEITGCKQKSTAFPHFHLSQAQITGSTQKSTAIPPFHLPQAVEKDLASVLTTLVSKVPAERAPIPVSMSHNIQLNSTTEETTNSSSLPDASRKGNAVKYPLKRKRKATKSTTPKIKIPSLIKPHKKPSFLNTAVSESSTSTQPLQTVAENSVLCKLCFMTFSSRMELVTHTWSWHRSTPSPAANPKCDECGKCFANSSLLKLHKKVKCTTPNVPIVNPGTMLVPLDSLLGNLIRQGVFMGPPQTPAISTAFWGQVRSGPSTAGVFSDGSVEIARYSTHLNVSSLSDNCPGGNGGNKNISTGAATETETSIHPDVAAGGSSEQPIHEELMQEDIKPVITATGEILEQSQAPNHETAGKLPGSDDSHKCTNCHMQFSDGFRLSLHQVSGRCKDARHDDVRCFACAKTFTSNIFRYLHVLNNPDCKDKADKYCGKCSKVFDSFTEKQEHLRMHEPCRRFEECLIKDVMKDPLAKTVDHVAQNVTEPESQPCPASSVCRTLEPDTRATPVLSSDNSTQITDLPSPNSVCCQLCKVLLPNEDTVKEHFQLNPACKTHSEKLKGEGASKQKSQVKTTPGAMCPACKKKFATSAVLILHFNQSPKCRMKLCSPSKVAKKISASDRIIMPKPVAPSKSPRKLSKGNFTKNSTPAAINASRNVFCDISSIVRSVRCKVCDEKFASEKELAKHHVEQKICKKLLATNLPKLKSLRIVLRRVSVMCRVCHLPFTDDTVLAEHLRLNQPCQTGTVKRIEKALDFKKSQVDSDTSKRDGKKRSCEIGTGISNVTSTISMTTTKDGSIKLAEQTAGANSIINEKLTTVCDETFSDDSSPRKKNVLDKGSEDADDKREAEDNSTGELISSLSSSDDGSDMDDSGSSSEEGGTDYTCKQCSKTYTSKSELMKHNKSHHSGLSKKAQCKVCTRKFHDVTGLQAHLLQFKFCFIPLTRPLWEQKQGPHSCIMCKKVLSSPKDLRKHCFKKMACRLRYVNMVLKNIKEKDNASVLPVKEAEVLVSKTVPEKCESQSANEVSSSVQDHCNPVEVDSSNSDVDVEDVTSCIKISHVVSKALTECLNCSGLFDDFQEHLLKQQSCLDFFGMPGNTCPVPLQFCYQCKTHFADASKLKFHPCKGFVAYTHSCQTCGLKFTNAHNFHAHVQQSLTCHKANSSSTEKNGDSDHTVISYHTAVQQDGAPAASAVENVPSTSHEQSFPCLICDGRFATLRLLMEHSYQHVEETPIACDRCSITFLHYNQFVSHQAFHIRMDKEANSLLERPPPSKFWASPNKNTSVRAQHDGTRQNHVSTCIFCCKEFATVKEKIAHLINDYACLAVLRYVVKSKLFTPDQKVTVTDPSFCEFCSRSSSDKLQHYLTSACFGRLEAAILKYRSSQHPAHLKEIDVAVSQTKQNEAGTRNIQSKHQGEHSSGKASPSRGPTNSGGKFSEEPCCLRCGRCFRTADEVKEHQTLFGHKNFLPQSVIKSADWQMPGLKCKICNVNYTTRPGLVRHMVNIHSNAHGLSQEVGNISDASCRLCNKKITPSQMSVHFENHRKKFVKKIREKSTQSLRAYSQETCVFCKKEFFSRKYVILHVKRHTSVDIFPPQSKASSAETSKQFPANHKSKLVEESQKLESACKSTAPSNIVGGCSLCQKKVTHIKYHRLHFTMSHKDLGPERWKEFFLPVADLKQECSPTKIVAKGGKLKGVVQKYGCALCQKVFVYRRSFMTHFARLHTHLHPERWEEFFKKIEQVTATDVHTVDAEFPEKESTNVKIQGRGYVSTKLKSCGKSQDSDSGVSNKSLKLQQKTVSCKVCSKEFSELRFFKVHFKNAHKQYKLRNWEDVYSVIGTEYLNSAHTEATEQLKHPMSETLRLKHTSRDSGSTSDDSADFQSELQIASISSVTKKTAKLRPAGSCKRCNKKFTNYTMFRFHAKKFHSVFTTEDQKRLFKVFVPPHHEDNSENSDSNATLTSSSPKKLMKYTTKSKGFSAFSSFRITLRVCRACQATFRDAFSYQEHLKTHIKPCKINLQELHSQLIPNMPGMSKDPGDLQVKMGGDGVRSLAKDIITIDDESQEECLYPDSTTSEDACVDTAAECDSSLNFSTQNKRKNSVNGSDYTNAGIPQSKTICSVVSKSHMDFVIGASKSVIATNQSVDTSKSGSSIASHQSDCMIRNESGSLEMFSDNESDDVLIEGTSKSVIDNSKSAIDANKSASSILSRQRDCMVTSEPGTLEMFSDDENDVPNKDSGSLKGPAFGNFVHTVVDSLFHDCSSDEAREKSQVRAVTLLDKCSSVSQHKQVPPDGANVGVKRKAQEAGFEEEQCSETKRSNLARETLCKDQTTNDSSCFLDGNSCEMNTVNEVHPEQIMEPQGHEMSCERLQLASVGVEDGETSVESPNISENVFERREVNKIDFREEENQICEIKNVDEVEFDQVQNVENEIVKLEKLIFTSCKKLK
ncbi:unnamed protein product [Candidula unifasciata]|uniref:C2H2-type domain-containing protein n=1 Tax=Candidula unifasciata TaxID=100452 RepID=A0A8S4A6R2_9EUPU|nr:unnamed protein product [Candidula unifasciata]